MPPAPLSSQVCQVLRADGLIYQEVDDLITAGKELNADVLVSGRAAQQSTPTAMPVWLSIQGPGWGGRPCAGCGAGGVRNAECP